MNNLNNEYYVLEPENNNSFPMIGASLKPRSPNSAVKGDYSLELYLEEPIPNDPKYVDFHTSDSTPVVSKAFKTLVEPLDIYGIQLLGTKGDIIDDLNMKYYLLHIYSKIECLDKKNSDIDEDELRVSDVRTFKLDSEKLNAIPVEKRLIFKLREYGVIQLFHKSIVGIIEEANLEGLRFIPVNDWNDNVAFH